MAKTEADEQQLQSHDGPQSPAPSPGKKKPHHWRLRGGAVASGLLLIGGFVLPWVQIGEIARVSGLELMISDNAAVNSAVGPIQRGLISLIPITGVLLVLWGLRNLPGLRWILLGAGLVLLVFGLVVVMTIFIQVTSLGLWLVVGGLLVALIVGGVVRA